MEARPLNLFEQVARFQREWPDMVIVFWEGRWRLVAARKLADGAVEIYGLGRCVPKIAQGEA